MLAYKLLFVHLYNFARRIELYRGRDDNPVLTAELLMAACFSIIIGMLFFVIDDIAEWYLEIDFSLIAFIICVIIQAINYYLFSYKKKYKRLLKKYNRDNYEPMYWGVVFILFTILFFPIIFIIKWGF